MSTVRSSYPVKLELLWSRQDSGVDLRGLTGIHAVDVTIDEFQIGGSLERGNQRVREYVSVLAGAVYFSAKDYDSDAKFSLGLGVGGKYFPFRNIALRANLRSFCTILDSEGGIYHNGVTVVTYSASTLWQPDHAACGLCAGRADVCQSA